ncbi:MAG: DUF2829 domain-containing protein [Turicibacter sp.]|nr:DUF2829 domain-containing protein [Turicibacter sp.]
MQYIQKEKKTIEAIQFVDTTECITEISAFVGEIISVDYSNASSPVLNYNSHLYNVGDYIVKEGNKIRKVKKDDFEEQYVPLHSRYDYRDFFSDEAHESLRMMVDMIETENSEIRVTSLKTTATSLNNYILSLFTDELKGKLTFEVALAAIKENAAARRASWPKGLFIFKQVPAKLDKAAILNMHSLPPLIKHIMTKEGAESICYNDQILRYNAESGDSTYYTPAGEDLFATDWEIILYPSDIK